MSQKKGSRARLSETGTALGQALFFALLALIIALPWPLGLNRDWAWSAALVLASILAFAVGLRRMHDDEDADLPYGMFLKVALACLASLLVLGLAYLVPTVSLDGTLQATSWPLLGALDPSAAQDAWLKRSLYFVLFALTVTLVRTRERLRLLMLAILLSGFLQAAYGAAMVVSGIEYSFFTAKSHSVGMVSGSYVNRNHFSNLAVMSAAVGIGLMVSMMLATRSQASTWKGHVREFIRALLSPKGRVRLVLIILVIAVVMTRSRMGNVSIFAALSIFSILTVVLVRPLPLKIAVFLVSVVIVDLVVVGQVFGLDQVVERLQGSNQVAVDFSTPASDQDRKAVIPIALKLWQERPWFGHGAGSFYTAFPAYRTIDFPGSYDHAHNDYLQFLVEYGLVGFALILTPLLLALGISINLLRIRHDALLCGAGFGLGMAILATLIHSTVEFVQQIPANAATLMVICAAVFAANRLPRRIPR